MEFYPGVISHSDQDITTDSHGEILHQNKDTGSDNGGPISEAISESLELQPKLLFKLISSAVDGQVSRTDQYSSCNSYQLPDSEYSIESNSQEVS